MTIRGQALGGMAIALLAGACAPAADEPPSKPSGVDVATPENPFFGHWELSRTVDAPWPHAGPAASPDSTPVVFEPGRSSGPAPLVCAKPRYAVDIAAPRSLFGGRLPDPARDAAALGLKDSEPTVLSFSCLAGSGDILAQLVMADERTILMAAGDAIRVYQRKP